MELDGLFLGGHNYHSCREYISVQAMEKSKEVLLKMIEIFSRDTESSISLFEKAVF